ncbi:hypothetical protein D7294_03900 [Streptomyces hoynatensis]|uniref:Endonuclease/exonuclease/phosphatase domain-containing protein n=2 Tax=Streptomyces hoynatensis TaxID=1141874 RepID=A0A3A9ZBQ3_9ACTN|nr:hypothetical protein D7294_03900 [Streptomyces hoynatensis]
MDWNVQGGQGADGVTDFGRVVEAIRQESPDLVTLQELHDNSAVGGENQWQVLLDELPGYYAHFARSDENALGGSAGNLILSRYPILERLTYLLPQYPQDTTAVRRSLGGVRLSVGGADLRVYTTHLSPGLGTEATERRARQARAVIDKLPASLMTTPMLLTGDLNVRPDDAIRPWFAAAGWLDAWTQVNANTGEEALTHPGDGEDARIDYVYATPAFDVSAAHTVPTTASDHLPVVAELTVHATPVAAAGAALTATELAGAAHVTAYADGGLRLRVCDNRADGWGVRAYVSAAAGGPALLTAADAAYADRCGSAAAPAGTADSAVVRVCSYQGGVEKDCRQATATA